MVSWRVQKTTLYLPESLQRRLRALARASRRPQAELIREALEGYVAAQSRPIARSIGAGSDESLAARDSEKWLRAEWDRR